MTCIVGLVSGGRVYIGGDSAGVGGLDITTRADKKVFKRNDMIFGFTSSFRMGQILRYSFDIPDHQDHIDVFEYMCGIFIPKLIECYKEHGYARVNNNEISGGIFLIGYKGRLFKVESDFQVGESADGYASCGCGSDYALGAMRLMMITKTDNFYPSAKTNHPNKYITSALETAEHFSAGVRGPFNFVEV